MNLLDTIERVLCSASKPLHCSEITKLVISNNLWNTENCTPDAIVGV